MTSRRPCITHTRAALPFIHRPSSTPTLVTNLLKSLAVFGVEFGCLVENPVQAPGRDYHRAGRISVDVVSRRDQHPADLHRNVGRIRHYGVAAPTGGLTATPDSDVIAAQLVEVSQSPVG